MTNQIPSSEDMRQALLALPRPVCERVAAEAGVPKQTVLNIRHTVGRGVHSDTMRRLWPALQKATAEAGQAPAEGAAA